jgi:hypothetical protein
VYDNESIGPSTTWGWKRVKMARPPEAIAGTRPKAGLSWFRRLPPWQPRRPLTLRITYRGGPEAWYEVHTRGGTIRRPGHVALHDLMREIYNSG